MGDTRFAVDAPDLASKFAAMFGQAPALFQAPGRINLIGEHTDYNEGFVLPAAIEFQTRIAIAKRPDRKLALYSENYSERAEFDLDALPDSGRHHWSDYIVGVVGLLEQGAGKLPGANLLVQGDVPQGAGLSSSASLEVAACTAFLSLTQQSLDGVAIATLCQKAENEFVGARCGIMDQFISVNGAKDHALKLDCRTLQFALVPIPTEVRLVICNTMVKHTHAGGEYNQRRAECEAGTRYFAAHLPGVKALRDVSLEQFEELGGGLPETIRKRCRHVISEDMRVLRAADALEANDLARFGQLMTDSHASLRDDFAVSCQELDLMVGLAGQSNDVYGARMTGGGFGGCTINLVRAERVEVFRGKMLDGYKRATGRTPEIYVSSAADGAGSLA